MAERDPLHPSDLGGDIPAAEAEVRAFWREKDIFRRSESGREGRPPFVFYEGPPTANGKPGVHHVISRLVKDVFCRYKTMTGHFVLRKGGWDTHGLPVEIEVEKELGLSSKDEVEAFGIAEFNARCRESVFKYKQLWDDFTGRIGFWLDLDDPYVTYEDEYIESVWWLLKQLWDKGLLYKGHKVLPYCARCETALSSHEVAQGYKDVDDPSVTVSFQREGQPGGQDEKLLVWTTTPWTLPSNVALAVGEDIDYARVRHEGQLYLLAQARVAHYFGDDAEVVGTMKGAELVGATYEQLIPILPVDKPAFRVVAADFVSTEDGTGIVHLAPAYGEDDNRVGQREDLPTLHPVDRSGRFVAELTPFAGMWVKDADKHIARHLKEEGKLFRQEQLHHSYPHCWRCRTPLLYYARDSWYIRTTQMNAELLAANDAVNWVPSGAGQERFGDWLRNNVDWALSRDRFWGTPLPVWECGECGHRVCVGSREEIAELGGTVPDDLHRPHVDGVHLDCPECTGDMRRSPEVIDVWFDSGAMPYAQWHYPFENAQRFEGQFPADFISEGMDQTRGWFYSLLAIATMVSGRSSYQNVVALGLLLDKHGVKMSKSRGNAVDPLEILESDGADPLRWYLSVGSPAWQPTRFDVGGIREHRNRTLGTLENVYAFYALYANLDGARGHVVDDLSRLDDQLDRWLLSRYHALVHEVTGALDGWDLTRAARAMGDFIVDELSNWYVRRSRRRFWKGEPGEAKQQAYDTLYTALEGLSRLLAPFTPFLAERLYRALHAPEAGDSAFAEVESVHLATWPTAGEDTRDRELEGRMGAVLEMVGLGRSLRMQHELRLRQPLRTALVHSARPEVRAAVSEERYARLVREELNLKELRWVDDPGEVASTTARANFRALGKRFGKDTPRVAKLVAGLDATAIAGLRAGGTVEVELDGNTHELGGDEVQLEDEGLAGHVSASEGGLLIALDTELDEELRTEGLARELVNRIQKLRKDAGLAVEDRIALQVAGDAAVQAAIAAHATHIREETLATELGELAVAADARAQYDIDGHELSIALARANPAGG